MSPATRVGRDCAICGTWFLARHREQRTCSRKCAGVYRSNMASRGRAIGLEIRESERIEPKRAIRVHQEERMPCRAKIVGLCLDGCCPRWQCQTAGCNRYWLGDRGNPRCPSRMVAA